MPLWIRLGVNTGEPAQPLDLGINVYNKLTVSTVGYGSKGCSRMPVSYHILLQFTGLNFVPNPLVIKDSTQLLCAYTSGWKGIHYVH